VTKAISALMHPRSDTSVNRDEESAGPAGSEKKARLVLEFVRERGTVHPREVDEHFSHGKVKNYWGGLSNATTHLMDAMHYRGLLRIARRENGIRIYQVCELTTISRSMMVSVVCALIRLSMLWFDSTPLCLHRASPIMFVACDTQRRSGAKR
jgi:hypothetical protein